MPIEKVCQNCKKKYYVKPSWKNKSKFCSRKCVYEFKIGKAGHKHTEKTKKRLSETKKGKKNPLWNGGTSISFYKRLAKENLIQKCSLCSSTKDLCVHHKDLNRKNNVLENLIIVCKSCHAKIHDNIKNITESKNNGK